MHFKNPEILYGLALLLIPIIVHLFQLRRFVKVPFTNVKFLKQIDRETRKSAVLKKWLVLITRSIALAALVFAFAQPYTGDHRNTQEYHTIIYMDNSLSMQARGERGTQLHHAVQSVLENLEGFRGSITLMTADETLEDLNSESLKNELMQMDFRPVGVDMETLELKISSVLQDKTSTLNNIILISDFKDITNNSETVFTNVNTPISLVRMADDQQINVFLDSVYMAGESSGKTNLKVLVKSNVLINDSWPVSLYNGDDLIGKSTARFQGSSVAEIDFTISQPKDLHGRIALTEPELLFDNTLFFSLAQPSILKVLSIGRPLDFLRRIYTNDAFSFSTVSQDMLNYNDLGTHDAIVLSEMNTIPSELISTLKSYAEEGGKVICIPGEQVDSVSYNNLFGTLGLGEFHGPHLGERSIISIRFGHELYQGVFEREISNFQYPNSRISYRTEMPGAAPVLDFDDEEAFLNSSRIGDGEFYWFAGPLNEEATNFTRFSLVVPLFFNMARHEWNTNILYHVIDDRNSIVLPHALGQNEVIDVRKGDLNFIPLHRARQNSVELDLGQQLEEAGIYEFYSGEELLSTIAFNYNRDESTGSGKLVETLVDQNDHLTLFQDLPSVFDRLSSEQEINWLFKWFLLISILFLLTEVLLLKFFRT